jgi:hypothetical protein
MTGTADSSRKARCRFLPVPGLPPLPAKKVIMVWNRHFSPSVLETTCFTRKCMHCYHQYSFFCLCRSALAWIIPSFCLTMAVFGARVGALMGRLELIVQAEYLPFLVSTSPLFETFSLAETARSQYQNRANYILGETQSTVKQDMDTAQLPL